MPLESHAGIGFAHALAVVDHLDEGFTGIVHNKPDLIGPASTAFSSNSFTALAGRWITSPAAIWLAMLSGNK